MHTLGRRGAILATLLTMALPGMAGESSFVFVPRADSAGGDYFAFTYNQARSVCFLKRAANQWMSFYRWAITGVKLSPVNQEPPLKARTNRTLLEMTE